MNAGEQRFAAYLDDHGYDWRFEPNYQAANGHRIITPSEIAGKAPVKVAEGSRRFEGATLTEQRKAAVKWARENDVRITSPTENGHRSAILCVAPAKPVEAYHGLKRARVVCSLREGAIRLSPHCYNTVEEMEKVIEVLDDL